MVDAAGCQRGDLANGQLLFLMNLASRVGVWPSKSLADNASGDAARFLRVQKKPLTRSRAGIGSKVLKPPLRKGFGTPPPRRKIVVPVAFCI